MATTTPRIGFYMPADDGSDPIDVSTDLNDNLEKLDSSIGFVPSTSSTPPVAPFDGMATYETDTGAAKYRKGGVWNALLSAGATFFSDIVLGVGSKLGLGNTSPSAYLDILQTSLTGATILRGKVSTESNPQVELTPQALWFGSGTGALDVGLARPSAGQLDITGSVNISNLTVSGSVTAGSISVDGDLDLGGVVTSPFTVAAKLSGTGVNVPNIIRKTTDFARTSTTAVADDPQITFFAEANSTYFVQTYLVYTGNAAGDFRFAWSVPAGTSGVRWVLGEAIAGSDYSSTSMRTSCHGLTTEVVIGAHTTGLSNGAMDTAIFVTGGTAGQITLRVGQGTSSTDATTLRTNTVCIYRKVE